MFHPAWSDQCLPSNEDQERRWMEDGLQNPLWSLQMSGHAFWTDQCTGHISGLHQPDPGREARRFCDSVPRWHPHLHREQRRRARTSHLMSARPTAEAFIVRQLQEVPISSGWGEIPRLHHLLSGIRMKEERIKAVRDWPKPQSVYDIQFFLGFTNFYRLFI